MPEVTATVATAAVAAAGKVTATVASSMTAVASSVTTATTVAAVPSRLGRHVGCGHHQTGSSDSREGIHSGQGPKGQQLAQSLVRYASPIRITHFSSPFVLFNGPQ
jgi:hypothetical protein